MEDHSFSFMLSNNVYVYLCVFVMVKLLNHKMKKNEFK